MNLYSAIITLILVMDPLGNTPLFLSALNNVNPKRRKWIIFRESLTAFFILLIFLFFGKYLLQVMQISQPALSISGGMILFLIAIKMIFSPSETSPTSKKSPEPFIVPLAVPFLAGPSALAFVMLLANQAQQQPWLLTLALFIAWLVCTIILVCSDYLRNILGDQGLTAMEKLMGMILTTMAVQMSLDGVQRFFQLGYHV